MDEQKIKELAERFLDLHVELSGTVDELTAFYLREDFDSLQGEEKSRFDILLEKNGKAANEIKEVWTKAKNSADMGSFYASTRTYDAQNAGWAIDYANTVLEKSYKPPNISEVNKPALKSEKGIRGFLRGIMFK